MEVPNTTSAIPPLIVLCPREALDEISLNPGRHEFKHARFTYTDNSLGCAVRSEDPNIAIGVKANLKYDDGNIHYNIQSDTVPTLILASKVMISSKDYNILQRHFESIDVDVQEHFHKILYGMLASHEGRITVGDLTFKPDHIVCQTIVFEYSSEMTRGIPPHARSNETRTNTGN